MACKVGTLPCTSADGALFARWCETGEDSRGRRVSNRAMTEAMRREGYDVGLTAVTQHRAGRCACRK